MLLCVGPNDKLQLITGQAVTVDVHVSAMDVDSSGVVTTYRKNTAVTTATTTDITAVAGSGTTRNVKTVNIRNKHASSSVDVTVQHTDGTVTVELHKVTLLPGEALEYIEGVGFYELQVVAAQNRALRLAADQSNATVTPTEVTAMSMTTGTGTFVFRYWLIYQSSATGTGVRFSVNHTGTVTSFVANLHMADVSAVASTAAAAQVVGGAVGQVYAVFPARAKSTAGWGTTISTDLANADMFARIEGLCTVSADGDLELWHGSETAAATTVKAGSSLILTRTGD